MNATDPFPEGVYAYVKRNNTSQLFTTTLNRREGIGGVAVVNEGDLTPNQVFHLEGYMFHRFIWEIGKKHRTIRR